MVADNLNKRIEVIDVLRGFALLGIIIVHMTEQYYAGQPPQEYANFTAPGLADQIVMGLIQLLIQGKILHDLFLSVWNEFLYTAC